MTRFNTHNLLKIQVRALQDSLPSTVLFQGRQQPLTKKERLAAGRAVWFVVQKGYGINTAVPMASGSFGVSELKIGRAVRAVFPDNYFQQLERNKNNIMFNEEG